MNTLPLFSYGSLMDADILRLVIGDEIESTSMRPAQLAGYRCVQLPNESFPVLQAEAGKIVQGQLIENLSALATDRIRFFEGDEYELEHCQVQTDAGARQALYCADVTSPGELNVPWLLADWQREHKVLFSKRVENYMKLFGTMSATEADAYWLASAATGEIETDNVT